MTDEVRAREAFSELPEEMQETVNRDGLLLARQAYAHTVPLLIGPEVGKSGADAIRHASGVMVQIGTKIYLATADHVVLGYMKIRKANPSARFASGPVTIPVETRGIWRDAERDVALILLRGSEPNGIRRTIWGHEHWPPRVPREGEYAIYGGYPAGYRTNTPDNEIDLNFVGGGSVITSSVERNFKCTLARDRLVPVHGDHVPPAHTNFGGMSGGPVFTVVPRNLASLTLVGLVTDFSNAFDTYIFGPLVGADRDAVESAINRNRDTED